MILNPTHEITLSGLPSEVLDAYVRYKKGSRAIVAWLVQYGATQYKGVKTLPIKELAKLAQKVASKVTEVPDVIHFHFKETIAARKCLSRFFRRNVDESEEEADTVNHEHFTNSLCQIYSELCERCRAADAERLARATRRRSGGMMQKPRTNYNCLPVEDITAVDGELTTMVADCAECKDTVPDGCQSSENSMQLEDDEISTAIENIVVLERVSQIYTSVGSCWQQAGRGELSLIAATVATNVAWRYLRDVDSKLRQRNVRLDLTMLHTSCCLFMKQQSSEIAADQNHAYHDLLKALEVSDRAIKHYTDGHKVLTNRTSAACIQQPSDYIKLSHDTEDDLRASLPVTMADNILHLLNTAGRSPALVLNSSPCFLEMSQLVTRRNSDGNQFQCVLAMHLLSTSYKAYFTSLPNPNAISMCRISALKLSKQASSTIARVLLDKYAFPCQCPQTLAFHLSNLQHDLDSYAKYKCWDLYFQSPWVSGNHMIEMLDILSYYGMRLFHYRHYIGSILHTYNILKQLASLDLIPVLEQVTDIFRETLFPGGTRPTSHFKNSWARFVGARLKFKKGHRGYNHRESWCMAVPAHAARNAAGLASGPNDRTDPKFDYGRLDTLMNLKQKDYRPDNDDSEPNKTIPSLSLTLNKALDSSNPTIQTTTLNIPFLFTLCVDAINQISTKIHTTPEDKDTKNCICFTTTLLGAGDRIVEGRRLGGLECWKKEERELGDVVGKILKDCFGGKVEGLRWDI